MNENILRNIWRYKPCLFIKKIIRNKSVLCLKISCNISRSNLKNGSFRLNNFINFWGGNAKKKINTKSKLKNLQENYKVNNEEYKIDRNNNVHYLNTSMLTQCLNKNTHILKYNPNNILIQHNICPYSTTKSEKTAKESSEKVAKENSEQAKNANEEEKNNKIIKPNDMIKGNNPSVEENRKKNNDIKKILNIIFCSSIPMIGFGFMDQFIMIRLGDMFDASIGVTLGISTLCAASFGQLCSDTFGVFFGSAINYLLQRYKIIQIEKFDIKNKIYQYCTLIGSVLGILLGCSLGMLQLLFIDTTKSERLKKKKELDFIFQMVMYDCSDILNCEASTLFLYDKVKNELWSKAIHGRKNIIKISANSNEKSFCLWVLRNKEIINCKDVLTNELYNPAHDKKFNFKTKTILAAPILDRNNEVIGVLMFLNKLRSHGGYFTCNDEKLAELMSKHISIFMEKFNYISEGDKKMIIFDKGKNNTQEEEEDEDEDEDNSKDDHHLKNTSNLIEELKITNFKDKKKEERKRKREQNKKKQYQTLQIYDDGKIFDEGNYNEIKQKMYGDYDEKEEEEEDVYDIEEEEEEEEEEDEENYENLNKDEKDKESEQATIQYKEGKSNLPNSFKKDSNNNKYQSSEINQVAKNEQIKTSNSNLKEGSSKIDAQDHIENKMKKNNSTKIDLEKPYSLNDHTSVGTTTNGYEKDYKNSCTYNKINKLQTINEHNKNFKFNLLMQNVSKNVNNHFFNDQNVSKFYNRNEKGANNNEIEYEQNIPIYIDNENRKQKEKYNLKKYSTISSDEYIDPYIIDNAKILDTFFNNIEKKAKKIILCTHLCEDSINLWAKWKMYGQTYPNNFSEIKSNIKEEQTIPINILDENCCQISYTPEFNYYFENNYDTEYDLFYQNRFNDGYSHAPNREYINDNVVNTNKYEDIENISLIKKNCMVYDVVKSYSHNIFDESYFAQINLGKISNNMSQKKNEMKCFKMLKIIYRYNLNKIFSNHYKYIIIKKKKKLRKFCYSIKCIDIHQMDKFWFTISCQNKLKSIFYKNLYFAINLQNARIIDFKLIHTYILNTIYENTTSIFVSPSTCYNVKKIDLFSVNNLYRLKNKTTMNDIIYKYYIFYNFRKKLKKKKINYYNYQDIYMEESFFGHNTHTKKVPKLLDDDLGKKSAIITVER
ncbi:GAF domain-related protein, putative [Plasmodium vinckei vinckei]|uniref:GAF domain-related protein, putative n=1 Tax=Plasmodium vinckei vinckei TaxID=54757 RepID=A0A449BMY4_PLAVN|nr:GAF domain-related protein, putative [Plasmodium vinckei vinckei]VEV54821.1 GAF domain-related protein, putative [Plasmodium vinckei vinckei]